MNSGRAKKIAKALYEDLSRRGAKYFKNPATGQITREVIRDRYQDAKKQHNIVVTVVKRKKTRVPKWYNKRNQGMKRTHQKNYGGKHEDNT